MSTPQTTIHICSGVRLNNNYDHTINFSTRAEQVAYFKTKAVKTFTGYAYLRKRWSIKVAATMGDARTWSYLFFMNPDPNTTKQRWAYYFITDVEYVNDSTVELSLELDVMQTYLGDYQLQECFVEREHSVADAFGENTIDEGLDTGDLVPVDSSMVAMSDYCTLILSTVDLVNYYQGTQYRVMGGLHDNTFCGMGVYAISNAYHVKLQDLLYTMDGAGITDAIVNLWTYPKNLVNLEPNEVWEDDGDNFNPFKKVAATSGAMVVRGNRPETMAGGYVPVNAKLRQYPYSLLYMTNNMGSAAAYRYEYWHTDGEADGYDYVFRVNGSVGADAAAKIYPTYYHNVADNYAFDDGVTISGFPTCAWNCDTFKLWLAQNQNQHSLMRSTAGLQVGAGAMVATAGALATATGFGSLVGAGTIATGMGMMASGLNSTLQLNAQIKDAAVQPAAARGSQSSNVNIAANRHCFQIIHKTVDPYHAKRLDDFFTMYGYKTCMVKKPNVDSRPHFNYVKTVASNVRGNICHADLAKINAVFDRGITFWKNGDEIGDYSVDNRPV